MDVSCSRPARPLGHASIEIAPRARRVARDNSFEATVVETLVQQVSLRRVRVGRIRERWVRG
jgi:hypothetical protein